MIAWVSSTFIMRINYDFDYSGEISAWEQPEVVKNAESHHFKHNRKALHHEWLM
tara:strand:+ start:2627 stop:2788 length:162 start_codon:yes stop_codon:yes gene_type:complete